MISSFLSSTKTIVPLQVFLVVGVCTPEPGRGRVSWVCVLPTLTPQLLGTWSKKSLLNFFLYLTHPLSLSLLISVVQLSICLLCISISIYLSDYLSPTLLSLITQFIFPLLTFPISLSSSCFLFSFPRQRSIIKKHTHTRTQMIYSLNALPLHIPKWCTPFQASLSSLSEPPPPSLVCIMHVALTSWSALTSIQPQVNHARGSDDVGAGHAKTGEDAFRSPSSTPNHHTWANRPPSFRQHPLVPSKLIPSLLSLHWTCQYPETPFPLVQELLVHFHPTPNTVPEIVVCKESLSLPSFLPSRVQRKFSSSSNNTSH